MRACEFSNGEVPEYTSVKFNIHLKIKFVGIRSS